MFFLSESELFVILYILLCLGEGYIVVLNSFLFTVFIKSVGIKSSADCEFYNYTFAKILLLHTWVIES